MQTKLEAALDLAAKGFHVFRLRPNDKKPLKGWQDEATRDPAKIRELFNGTVDYNIGIYTGKYEDSLSLVVVDVDTKEGKKGAETMEEHDMFGRDFPPTLRVRTASGGYHLFYWIDTTLSSGANKLGQHVDVKSSGAYVVGPGSTIDLAAYQIEDDREIESIPLWIIDWVGYPREREITPANEDQDTPAMIQRAIAYLEQTAPTAIQGSGRNNTYYRVACEIRDYGISQPTATDLLWKHYNPTKCQPPYEYERVETVVNSAFRYAKSTAGNADPKLAFSPIPGDGNDPCEDPKARAKFPLPTVFWQEFPDDQTLPPREWLIDRYLLKGAVTTVVAPGGVGKSLLSIAFALTIATGEPIINLTPNITGKTWIINNEDDKIEITRRMKAHEIYHSLDTSKAKDKILITAGTQNPITIAAKNRDKMLKETPHITDMMNQIRSDNIQLLVVDPLAEIHDANENDNMEMKYVMALLRRIAHECNISVLVIHHTKKLPQAASDSFAGNADAGRGASAIRDSARINLTLMEASPADQKEYGIPAKDRYKYARLDDSKMNLAPKSPTAFWLKRENVRLKNGDNVGALTAVDMIPRASKLSDLLVEMASPIVVDSPGKRITVNKLAETLKADAFFKEEPLTTLRRSLKEAFEDTVDIATGTIIYERIESEKAKDWIIFEPKIDDSEGSSAK